MVDKAISTLPAAGPLDGTELVHVVKGGNSRQTTVSDMAQVKRAYDIRTGFVTTPTASEVLDTILVGRELLLPADLAGSLGLVSMNPTSSFVMSLLDDGAAIATITVDTGGALTFATTGNTAQTVTIGSTLTLVAPASVDATIEGVFLTILGSA